MAHVLISEKKSPKVIGALQNYFGLVKPVHKEWGIIFYQVIDKSERRIKPVFMKFEGVDIFVIAIK